MVKERRPWGTKAADAKSLARDAVLAQRDGRFADAQEAYEALVALVSRGNVAFHILTAEEELR